METEENNKLISEFMGAELDDYCAHYDECKINPTLIKGVNPNWREYDKMEYHISWDWLMPVVEKIMDLCFSDNDQETYDSDKFYEIRDCIPITKTKKHEG
jgi:hypothetical protein